MVQVWVFFLPLGILQKKKCLFYPVKVTCRVLKKCIAFVIQNLIQFENIFLCKQKGKVLSAALTDIFHHVLVK